MSELQVYLDGLRAGTARIQRGVSVFEYATEYALRIQATPLSVSIPLESGTQPADAWLDGLLPDNDEVRREWAHDNGAKDIHPMTLLGTPIGLDCAGAVQFCRPGTDAGATRISGTDPVSDGDIAAWIRRARTAWGTGGRLGSRGQFSLGGAQAKYALRREEDQWAVPYGDTPTTHIIKPGIVDLDDADLVEHVCMRAAGIVGLPAARTEIERFVGERAVVVERFDRAQVGGRTVRLHHEDLCQALGVPPDKKYQDLGGPSPEDIVDLFRRESVDPHLDTRRFMDALIFNWVIGATDAHAKNYSLLLDRGEVRLAPLYDLISYLPWADEPHWKTRTAMRVGRGYTLRRADRPEVWERTAHAFGLGPQAVVQRALEMLDRVPEAIGKAIGELAPRDRVARRIQLLQERIDSRCKDVLPAFAAPPGTCSKLEAKRGSSKPAASSGSNIPRTIVCEQPLAAGRGECGRRLVTAVCPFHPQSPGSEVIRSRLNNLAEPGT